MAAGKFNDLPDFCFGDLVGENAADTHTVAVDMQHHLDRGLAILGEELLQDMDDELHGRVVVVQQQHLVEAGLLGLGARVGDDAGAGTILALAVPVIVARILHSFLDRPCVARPF